MAALRLIAFDATDTAPPRISRGERLADGTAEGAGGLTRWWRIGALMHRGALRADGALAARDWREAARWAAVVAQSRGAPIAELQAWGHGGWGFMGMGDSRLDGDALRPGSALAPELDALRDALAPDALVWLRCCSAFGHHGRDFAARLADRLRVRVAGHTHVIGIWQSGTHSLAPGERAAWDPLEGVATARGVAEAALDSRRTAPNTIHCLRLGLPAGY